MTVLLNLALLLLWGTALAALPLYLGYRATTVPRKPPAPTSRATTKDEKRKG